MLHIENSKFPSSSMIIFSKPILWTHEHVFSFCWMRGKICRHMTLKFYSSCSFSLCDKIQMRTTCSITKTCVAIPKRRNLCCRGNFKILLVMLSMTSWVFGSKGNVNVENEKLTNSPTECSILSVFPRFRLENFPTDAMRGNCSGGFLYSLHRLSSDRIENIFRPSDLIRSVCL